MNNQYQVKFKSKSTNIDQAPASYLNHVETAFKNVLERVVSEATKRAPKRTGRLKGEKGGGAGIKYRVEKVNTRITGIVSATALDPTTGEDYAPLIHGGSGVFGPERKPIKPKHAKMLVWLKDGNPNPTTKEGWAEEQKKDNVWRAKQVSGIIGVPFLADGLVAGWKKAPAEFKNAMQDFNSEVK